MLASATSTGVRAHGVGCQRAASTAAQSLRLVRPCCRPVSLRRSRQAVALVRADSRNGDGFMTGFVVGGVVFGALGFLFAPQISRALLGEDQRLKLPRFLDDDQPRDPEATKQDLLDKINKLNASIDEVTAQLQSDDDKKEEKSTLKIAT